MRLEEGRSISPEGLQFGETRIRVAPPITPNELFGRTLRDERNLALTTSPLHMFKVIREGSQSEHVVVLPPLYGQQFWHFINTIAPLPYKMDIDGLITDWGMPDEAERAQYKRDRLTKHEGSMGEDWDIFERSRHIFIDTLKMEPTWQRRSTWRFTHNFLRIDYAIEERLAREIVATLETNSDLRESFGAFLQSSARFKNRKWLTDELDGIHRRVSAWDSRELRALGRDFLVAELKDPHMKGRESVIGLYNAFDTGVRLDLVDGRVFLTVGNILKGEVSFFSDKRGNTGWMMDPEAFISANFLLPTIQWTRNGNGEIVLNFDFLEEATAEEVLSHVVSLPSDLQFDTRRLNPVPGFGSIPYFIPELRKDWPQYQKIVLDTETDNYQVVPASSEFEAGAQFMSAQAALVMALQHKDTILQNEEFFDRAEEHIIRHAA